MNTPLDLSTVGNLLDQTAKIHRFVESVDSIDWQREEQDSYAEFLQLCKDLTGWDDCRLLSQPESSSMPFSDWRQLRSDWLKLRDRARELGRFVHLPADAAHGEPRRLWNWSADGSWDVAYSWTQLRQYDDCLLVAFRNSPANPEESYEEGKVASRNLRLAAMCFRGRPTLPSSSRYFSTQLNRRFEQYEELEREADQRLEEINGHEAASNAAALLQRLNESASRTGRAHAMDFERLVCDVFQFGFSPQLSEPLTQHELHGGSKLVDIVFVNRATDGFFLQLPSKHLIPCPYVFVECKNYESDVVNPEMDQLLGRFAIGRTKFGFLACNRIRDRMRLLHRCREAARDGQGWILAVDVDDLRAFVQASFLDRDQPAERVWKLLDDHFRMLVF